MTDAQLIALIERRDRVASRRWWRPTLSRAECEHELLRAHAHRATSNIVADVTGDALPPLAFVRRASSVGKLALSYVSPSGTIMHGIVAPLFASDDELVGYGIQWSSRHWVYRRYLSEVVALALPTFDVALIVRNELSTTTTTLHVSVNRYSTLRDVGNAGNVIVVFFQQAFF